MRLLREAGLYGEGLFAVRTPEMRDRYNKCLEAAGIAPTALARFGVDGMGWSPEVAEEKRDRQYLSQGDANQLAVILSPDQSECPIYHPLHSFDLPMMARYYSSVLPQVGDITRDTGIWLDIDLGITAFSCPRDLLLVDGVSVRTAAVGNILEAAREQQELVRRFRRAGDSWFDPQLRRQIIASAVANGDLRERRLEIPAMAFAGTRNFHTRALGGVFVLRDVKTLQAILVCANGMLAEEGADDGVAVVSLGDPDLPTLLMEAGLADIDFDWYMTQVPLLERMHESLLAETVCGEDPNLDFDKLTSGQKKGHIKRLQHVLPASFFELERLMKRLQKPGFVNVGEFSPELQKRLLHPAVSLDPALRDLVWDLLVKLGASDVVRLYRHDKGMFFDQYATWTESRKRWVTGFLKRWRGLEG